MLKTLVFVALFLLCTAQTPTRPELSESFQAKIDVTTTETNPANSYTAVGKGFWTRSMDESSQVEEIEFVVKAGGQSIPYNTYIVQRYDLNPPKIFEVDQSNGTQLPCNITTVSGPFPPMWEYLKTAKYMGTVNINGHHVDMWNETFGNMSIAVGVEVNTDGHAVPYLLRFINGTVTDEVIFNEFHLEPPHDQHSFKIPDVCKTVPRKILTTPLNHLFKYIHDAK